MTPRQLEALRKHLHFTVPEAARWVAADAERPRGVEERTWNRWEAGKVAIPMNIAERMFELVHYRRALVELLKRDLFPELEAGRSVVMIWYDDRADWTDQPVYWRPFQSALAELLSSAPLGGFDLLRLVPFDAQSFNRRRGARPDHRPHAGSVLRAVREPAPPGAGPGGLHGPGAGPRVGEMRNELGADRLLVHRKDAPARNAVGSIGNAVFIDDPAVRQLCAPAAPECNDFNRALRFVAEVSRPPQLLTYRVLHLTPCPLVSKALAIHGRAGLHKILPSGAALDPTAVR